MKYSKVSAKDWEALSAYLDGELTPSESIRLEERLSSNADLQAALDEIRQTSMILQRVPKMQIPRSFTLTPNMVRGQQPHRFYPYFRLVFALTSILFVITFTGDLMGFGIPLTLQRDQAAQSIQVIDTVTVEKEEISEPEIGVSSGSEEAFALAEPAVEEVVEAEISAVEKETEKVIPESERFVAPVEAPEPAEALEGSGDQTEGIGGGSIKPGESQTQTGVLEAADSTYPDEATQLPLAMKITTSQDGDTTFDETESQGDNALGSAAGQEAVDDMSNNAFGIEEPVNEPVQEMAPKLGLLQIVELSLLSITIVSGLVMVYLRRK